MHSVIFIIPIEYFILLILNIFISITLYIYLIMHFYPCHLVSFGCEIMTNVPLLFLKCLSTDQLLHFFTRILKEIFYTHFSKYWIAMPKLTFCHKMWLCTRTMLIYQMNQTKTATLNSEVWKFGLIVAWHHH